MDIIPERGIARFDLVGVLPIVECRPCGGELRYFVCFPDLKAELVMAFEEKLTARELAVNVYHGTPFYTAIPIVRYRTPYPRPWLVYPKLGDTWRRIEMIVVRQD
jgi:hypothetical protein